MRYIELPLDDVIDRYAAGESVEVLSKSYGVGAMTIWRRLKDAGMRLRGFGGMRPGGPLHIVKGHLRTVGRDGKVAVVHRVCWETYNGSLPKGLDVHHVNGDPRDNRIENLACISHGEHTRLHAPWKAYQ